jgi:hypothetical protein
MMMIDWQPIETAPHGEPVLVTSNFWPGWFEIGGLVLGEWRRGVIAGDVMPLTPTHWARLNPVEKLHHS